jgi:hypothetical protein
MAFAKMALEFSESRQNIYLSLFDFQVEFLHVLRMATEMSRPPLNREDESHCLAIFSSAVGEKHLLSSPEETPRNGDDVLE